MIQEQNDAFLTPFCSNLRTDLFFFLTKWTDLIQKIYEQVDECNGQP